MLVFADNIDAQQAGAIPALSGFAVEQENGATIRIFADPSGTKCIRATCPAGTGAQRAEMRQDSPATGTTGVTRWFGMDMRFVSPALQSSGGSAWGPLPMQQRRRNTSGNGPIALEMPSGQLTFRGRSGLAQPSQLAIGALPAATIWTRIVFGIYHHLTAGWVESWRDGAFVARVEPWSSANTATGDGTPPYPGSTLDGVNPSNAFKFGCYRGGGPVSAIIDHRRIVVATTREEVMLGQPSIPTAPTNLRSALTFQET